jgi:NosR/NirI family transcriptional regulator, nitrous oxide reductase regulator
MSVPLRERPEAETVGSSPARRLTVARREGFERHFRPTDPRIDLLRLPLVGRPLNRAVKSRPFQFALILPNQIVFWLVIATGLIGAAVPQRNFSTVITWYLWFCVVFVLMVGVGRAWCMMCPFGGAAEWVQRRTFWQRHPISIGLHRKWPASWSRYGMLPSLGVFLALTWAEEFLNIAGPGRPLFTGLMVVFIISFAVGTFLVFDRRTFCRYLCPLTVLIGSVGSTGMVAGLRTRDRELCLRCPTKDCMRGSERGYPCPWYEWPGSATSNLMCGLCTECVKNCPYDNVGLFVQPPLTSVVAPVRRRLDVALAVLVLFGLVVFQQVNTLGFYGPLDNGLNNLTHFASYPNPIDFVSIIAAVTGLFALYVWALRAGFGRRRSKPDSTNGVGPGFTAWLMPIAYGVIPLMAVDYLARQLPKFWLDLPKLIASVSDPFGFGWNLFGTAHAAIAGAQILSPEGVIVSQVVLVGLGTLGAVYATVRIVGRDLRKLTGHPRALAAMSALVMALSGAALGVLYVAMGAAT